MGFIRGGLLRRPVQGILFDMDGLLVDSERLAIEADETTFAELGLHVDRAALLSTLGETDEHSSLIFASADSRFDSAVFWPMTHARFEEYLSSGRLQRKEGALELLGALRERGIPVALASSSGHARIERSLEACGLKAYFPVIVSGEDGLPSKPAPDIFLHAARAIHLQPGDCLVLEDSYNGIRAGRGAGMQVCMVPDLLRWKPEWEAYADHVCDTLQDVLAMLERMPAQPSGPADAP